MAAKKKEGKQKWFGDSPQGRCKPDFLIALISELPALNRIKALPAAAGNISKHQSRCANGIVPLTRHMMVVNYGKSFGALCCYKKVYRHTDRLNQKVGTTDNSRSENLPLIEAIIFNSGDDGRCQ